MKNVRIWAAVILAGLMILGGEWIGARHYYAQKYNSGVLWRSITSIPESGLPELYEPPTLGTNRELSALFDTYNREYFGGRLKKIPVEFGKSSPDILAYFQPRLVPLIVPAKIVVQPQLRDLSLKDEPKEFRDIYGPTLLHEMAHECDWQMYPKDYRSKAETPTHHHGKVWQGIMRSLAAKGAFDAELWNTDESDPNYWKGN